MLVTPECKVFDFDSGDDVDLFDAMGFQAVFSGPRP